MRLCFTVADPAMDITAIVRVAVLITLCVFTFGIISSALHLIFAGIRVLRDGEAQLDKVVAWRWPALLAATLWLVICAVAADAVTAQFGATDSASRLLRSMLFIAGIIPVLVLPVAPPLFELWRYHRASSPVLAAASVVAFPVVISLVVGFCYLQLTDNDVIARLEGGVSVVPQSKEADLYYLINPREGDLYHLRPIKPGDRALTDWLRLPDLDESRILEQDFQKHRAALWLEMSLNSASFELLTNMGLHFSQLEFNTESNHVLWVLPSLYRFAFTAVFWAALLLLVRSGWRAVKTAVHRRPHDPNPAPATRRP